MQLRLCDGARIRSVVCVCPYALFRKSLFIMRKKFTDQNFNLGPGFWSYGQKDPKWLEIRKLQKFLESFLFFALGPIGRHGVSSKTAAGTQDQGHRLSSVLLNVAWK